MMKNFYSFLCFLILFWSSSSADTGKFSEPRGAENFHTEYFIRKLPIEKFVQFLVDIRVDTTSKFINLKNEGGLPDGISDNPLEDYPELERQWSNLWNRVLKAHPSMKEDIAAERSPSSQFEKIGSTLLRRSQGSQARKEIIFKRKRRRRRRQPEYLHSGPFEKKKKELLTLVTEEPHITIPKMAKELKMPVSRINQIIAILKKEKRLARVGRSSKYGRWVALQDGAEPPRYQSLAEVKKEELLALVTEDPHINKYRMAEKLEVSVSTILQITAILKKEKRLARVGRGAYGRWVVLQDGAESPRYQYLSEVKKEELLALVTEDPHISKHRMAEKLEVSVGIISQIIVILKKEKRLTRTGGRRFGCWIAFQDGAEPPLSSLIPRP